MLGHNFDIKKDFHSIEVFGQSASADTRNDPRHGMLDSDSPMWASDHRAVMLTINTLWLLLSILAALCTPKAVEVVVGIVKKKSSVCLY